MSVKYRLKRSARKTMSIKVENGQVFVFAPLITPKFMIDDFVKKHEKWIENKINDPRINVCFDLEKDKEIYFLGKKFNLYLITGKKSEFLIRDNNLMLCGKSIRSIKTNYKKQLAAILTQYVNEVKYELGIEFKLDFKIYKSRWGCCYSKKNLIILNYLLACLPYELIKYVIYHEITHFKQGNHQRQFYQELEKICPNYKRLAKELKNYTIVKE
ncbi:MAG: M48 family metallopeptidase [Erysipelotrichia bacterium]|nr:M48 family metallopeptidase [Erysipelotrichia bacterium]